MLMREGCAPAPPIGRRYHCTAAPRPSTSHHRVEPLHSAAAGEGEDEGVDEGVDAAGEQGEGTRTCSIAWQSAHRSGVLRAK